jgi:cyclic beta-1,2-glucan synthetase
VLDVPLPFLEGPPLPRGAEGHLVAPRISLDAASLYEHCRRAIEWSLARCGRHGLPLLGSGDWNDGFDVAGLHGRGESLWLGFFLHDVLQRFAPIARRREGEAAAQRYRDRAEALRVALRAFRREARYAIATDDDGAELTGDNALLAAWPALSGAVDAEEGLTTILAGLRALERDDRILLLDPPYTDDSHPYPGRITEYPEGVRENGGQYSHGVSWLVDGLLRCAAQFEAAGRRADAAHCRQRALDTWRKISPLPRLAPRLLAAYGLPPHQQPADIYDGPGHGGRGGWSWYTGAAARMLSAAYELLGVQQSFGPQPPALPARMHRVPGKGP